MRTAESVLLTCWPPAPDARYVSTCRSSESISTSAASSIDGRHLDARERRLAAVGGVERRQPHEPVHALLGAVEPVRVLALDLERRGLDAGLLPRAHLEQLDAEAALLGPLHLHAQHHLGPVLRVGPAGAGVHRDERVAVVVAPGEQALLLELLQAAPRSRAACSSSSRRDLGILERHLGEAVEILDLGAEAAELLEALRGARVVGRDLRGGVLVVPEARRGHLVLEDGYAFGKRSWVKDSPRAGTSAPGSPRGAGGCCRMRSLRPWLQDTRPPNIRRPARTGLYGRMAELPMTRRWRSPRPRRRRSRRRSSASARGSRARSATARSASRSRRRRGRQEEARRQAGLGRAGSRRRRPRRPPVTTPPNTTNPPPPPPPDPPPADDPLVYSGPFGVAQAQRLLWRAGFGPKPGEAEALAALGLKAAVQSLTRPVGTADARRRAGDAAERHAVRAGRRLGPRPPVVPRSHGALRPAARRAADADLPRLVRDLELRRQRRHG